LPAAEGRHEFTTGSNTVSQPVNDLETDPRFPSGPWTGFFLQKLVPGRHRMEMHLRFVRGAFTGEGRDWVGRFILRGRYSLADGKCHWTKRYLGKHDVFYQGFNEGKGIWGVWEIPESAEEMYQRGGFHIWPEGMPDPTGQRLTAQADLPLIVVPELEESAEPAEVP
jgi:hypothetical protein